MEYANLQALFSMSPSMRLLRARHAPLIISFLYQEFKLPNRIAIPNYELVDRLADYLDVLGVTDEEEELSIASVPLAACPDGDNLKLRARNYLESWCNEPTTYLRKYPDDDGVEVHELMPSTEKVIQWIQDLEHKEFVGTESRFLDIVSKLKDIQEHSTDNPEQKIAALTRKKAEIEAQIKEIQTSGVVQIFTNTQIKERAYEMTRSARQLLSDFREVEQNFRELVRQIYARQAEQESKKGEILHYVLEETEALKHSDQGKSFATFWQMLMDPARSEAFDQAVEEVYRLLSERRISYEDTFLQHLKFHLLDAGKKVIDTNQVLVEKLKRILAGQQTLERKRTIELIKAIKTLALQVFEHPPEADWLIEIDGLPEIRLPLERPLGEMPQIPVFEHHPVEIGSNDLTTVDFTRLVDRFEINKEELVTRIQSYLKRRKQITLTQVLQDHPIQHGLEELLTYFSIASQSSKHVINDQKHETVELRGASGRVVKIPQIIFTK